MTRICPLVFFTPGHKASVCISRLSRAEQQLTHSPSPATTSLIVIGSVLEIS